MVNKMKNTYINNTTTTLILFVVKKLKISTPYSTRTMRMFYIYFCLTRISVILCLILDVFISKQIFYLYYILIITIITLLIKYSLYLLKRLNDEYLNKLSDYMIEITSEDDEDHCYFVQPSSLTYDAIVETQYFRRLQNSHMCFARCTCKDNSSYLIKRNRTRRSKRISFISIMVLIHNILKRSSN